MPAITERPTNAENPTPPPSLNWRLHADGIDGGASLGVGLSIVSGQALLSHFSSSERAESLVRQRSHWSRTVQFIEAEVALSERSITNPDNINIPTACAAGSNPEDWFRVALEIRRDLPLVIYGVSPVTDNSAVGSHMLWRCGPGILASGQYDGSNYSSAMVIDGLDGACGLKILADSNNDCQADTAPPQITQLSISAQRLGQPQLQPCRRTRAGSARSSRSLTPLFFVMPPTSARPTWPLAAAKTNPLGLLMW